MNRFRLVINVKYDVSSSAVSVGQDGRVTLFPSHRDVPHEGLRSSLIIQPDRQLPFETCGCGVLVGVKMLGTQQATEQQRLSAGNEVQKPIRSQSCMSEHHICNQFGSRLKQSHRLVERGFEKRHDENAKSKPNPLCCVAGLVVRSICS